VKPSNVLVTAASRRVPLVRAFQAALKAARLRGQVVATDISAYAAAVHVADRAYRVPMASDPDYVDTLLALCESERIALFVPTIDDELEACGAAREAFAARGTFAACSSRETAALCNDKRDTCRRLRAAGVSAARTWLPGEVPSDAAFPLFIKPRSGRGAVGAYPVRNRHELDFFTGYVEDPVIQEYLDGPEFTIDVLCDAAGRVLSIVPRERVVVRAGVIDRGRTVRRPDLLALADAVCAAVPFIGALNIQCRMRHGVPVVFEVNPRFSGGIPLTIAAGADFPAQLIALARGHAVLPQVGRYREDLWITKYESAVFIPGSGLELPPAPAIAVVDVA
jgi:carbamoyl-phosphate synthase large subunit